MIVLFGCWVSASTAPMRSAVCQLPHSLGVLETLLMELMGAGSLSSSSYPAGGAFCLDLTPQFSSTSQAYHLQANATKRLGSGDDCAPINSGYRAISADIDRRVNNLTPLGRTSPTTNSLPQRLPASPISAIPTTSCISMHSYQAASWVLDRRPTIDTVKWSGRVVFRLPLVS